MRCLKKAEPTLFIPFFQIMISSRFNHLCPINKYDRLFIPNIVPEQEYVKDSSMSTSSSRANIRDSKPD